MELGGDSAEFYARRQKRDFREKGAKCGVPRIAGLGALRPFTMLRKAGKGWKGQRGSTCDDGPLFPILSTRAPMSVTYNAVRNEGPKKFDFAGAGAHSLRNGGAAWMRFTLELSEEVARSRGG